jgi:hypothetical protein
LKHLRRACFGLTASIAVAAVSPFAATAVEPPAPIGSVTIVGESGHFVVGNRSLAYSSIPTATLFGVDVVRFSLKNSPTEFGYSLWFAPPPGERLQVGTYENVQRAPFQQPGHAGMNLSGDGRGCNQVEARFTVHRVEYGRDGVPYIFESDFQHRCVGDTGWARGSISYVTVPPAPSFTVQTTSIEFGVVDNRSTSSQSIEVKNNGQVVVGVNLAVTGLNRSDFALYDNTCAAPIELQPLQSCSARVEFAPTSGSGLRQAEVLVSDRSVEGLPAPVRTVALSGTANPIHRIQVSRDWVDFGTFKRSSGPTQTIQVRNDGDLPVTLKPVVVQNAKIVDFKLVRSTCDGVTLFPGVTCDVEVSFKPRGKPGYREGYLLITDDLHVGLAPLFTGTFQPGKA